MPRSVQDILDHADELAARFEAYEPTEADERTAHQLAAVRRAVLDRAAAERALLDEVTNARAAGASWKAIGEIVGTSGEAARQRYSREGPGRRSA